MNTDLKEAQSKHREGSTAEGDGVPVELPLKALSKPGTEDQALR